MSKKKSKILPPIKGKRLPALNDEFNKMGDFLFHEGPLLSHLINQHDEDFFIQWCGNDREFNRWLLYKTNYELLFKYFNKQLSDLDLLLKNPDGFAYIIDMDKEAKWKNIWIVSLEDIPPEYLPNGAVNYDPEDFAPYAEKLKAYIQLHFSRPIKSYKAPEATIEIVAEPPPNIYEKKKKGKG
ncbi:MAG TPA: hypothetical protein ENJ95_04320 [Bacteroidetes bacterium]|nr:hypothetical protein [Bacteroidota bacterium]